MRIVLLIFSQNENILHLQTALENMGHEVKIVNIDSYQLCCSYFAKKIDELGFHNNRNKFIAQREQEILSVIKEWQPDKMLFVNSPEDIIRPEIMKKIKQDCSIIGCKLLLWLVDDIRGKDKQTRRYFSQFDKIFVFENLDKIYLKTQYGIDAEYCPVGYNSDYRYVSENVQYEYDVSFVGMPYKNRMVLLERIAKEAKLNNWRLGIFGPFYDNAMYFWKKYQRKYKYPNLFKYVHDGRLSSADVASLYRKSKICLNIHIPHAKGMNPRTFEIIATGAFEIIDKRDYYDKIIPGKHLETFANEEDLIKKIDYYLKHEQERKKIATEGKKLVEKYYHIEQSLETILM